MSTLGRVSRQTLAVARLACRFGSKQLVADPPPPIRRPFFHVRSLATSAATAATTLLIDFKASPVPMVAVPRVLSGDNKSADELVLYSLSSSDKKETARVVLENRKSYLARELKDAKLMGSSKGWLLYMNRQDCNLYLCNPFSTQTSPIILLPPIETLPDVRARLFRRRRSRSETPTDEFDHEFVLNDWYPPRDDAGGRKDPDLKWFQVPIEYEPDITTAPAEAVITHTFSDGEKIHFASKMVLSSPPPSPSNDYANYRDCIVAMAYGPDARLAFCRLGDTSWTPSDGPDLIQDMAFTFDGNINLCLYTWDRRGRLECCNLSNTKSKSPEWNLIREGGGGDFGWCSEYLVKSATEPGSLLLVGVDYEEKVMALHKLDLFDAKKSWVPVESLHDQALFVGDFSETLSVPAAHLPPQLKPNCVYFNNLQFSMVGAFSLEDKAMDFNAFDDLGLDLPSKEEIENQAEDREWMAWVTPNPW